MNNSISEVDEITPKRDVILTAYVYYLESLYILKNI